MKNTQISEVFASVREKRPLVHHITNYVTVNDCANITISAGAAPVIMIPVSVFVFIFVFVVALTLIAAIYLDLERQ